MPMNGTVAIVPMKKEKDCKGSIRYGTPDQEEIVTNSYVSRGLAKNMPEEVVVVIVPVPAGKTGAEVAANAAKLFALATA